MLSGIRTEVTWNKRFIERERYRAYRAFAIQPGADPGIKYQGQVGVQESMNIITNGERGAQAYPTM